MEVPTIVEYTVFPISRKTSRTCKVRTFRGSDYASAQQKAAAWFKKHPNLKEDGVYVCHKSWLSRN